MFSRISVSKSHLQSRLLQSCCDLIDQNPESVELSFMFRLNTNLNVKDSQWHFWLER